MRGLRTAKTKYVLCTHCSGANEVARRAMSVFCVHCRKRLILENYTIKTYQALKGYSTCGDVVVEKSGRVAAPIQAHTLTVKGIMEGNVETRGRVEITSTGSLVGDVSAPALCVKKGAKLLGLCRIRPLPPAAPETGTTGQSQQRRPPPASATADSRKNPRPKADEGKHTSPGVIKPIRTTRRRTRTLSGM